MFGHGFADSIAIILFGIAFIAFWSYVPYSLLKDGIKNRKPLSGIVSSLIALAIILLILYLLNSSGGVNDGCPYIFPGGYDC